MLLLSVCWSSATHEHNKRKKNSRRLRNDFRERLSNSSQWNHTQTCFVIISCFVIPRLRLASLWLFFAYTHDGTHHWRRLKWERKLEERKGKHPKKFRWLIIASAIFLLNKLLRESVFVFHKSRFREQIVARHEIWVRNLLVGNLVMICW